MPSLKLTLMVLCVILQSVRSNNNFPDRRRFCGERLTESLQYFCRHRYASPTLNNEKRSDDTGDNAYPNDQPLADGSPFSYKSFPFLDNFASAAAALRAPRVRRDYWYLQRGVADECCRKPCTFQQLTSYCY